MCLFSKHDSAMIMGCKYPKRFSFRMLSGDCIWRSPNRLRDVCSVGHVVDRPMLEQLL